MPRIRKKTSKRRPTHERSKLQHKVTEGRKKKRKEAKKNPQWKSKKKKDPGIPNNFPFKDEILAEVAEIRRQAEETKQRRKEEKKAAREAGLQNVEDNGMSNGPSLASSSSKKQLKEDEDEAPILLNRDLPNLKVVLEKADIVLHILDARDPTSFLLPELVAESKKEKVVYILNKIDIAPKESLVAWLKHLRQEHPTFLFRSASAFLPRPPSAEAKIKGKEKESERDALGSQTLLEFLGQRAQRQIDRTLQVAVVGQSNSGKSALINSLAKRAAVPVYILTASTEAWSTTTTRAYEVEIPVGSHTINFIDTPGVSFEKQLNDDIKIRDMLIRSRGRVDKVKDPVPPVDHIVARADTQDLMVLYNLPAFAKGDVTAFLSGIARANGMLKKNGDPDLPGAGRIVLRDWATGKLPYYSEAPPASSHLENSEALDETLEVIYEKADKAALRAVKTRKEMRKESAIVLIKHGDVETRKVVIDSPFIVQEENEIEDTEGLAEEDDEEEEVSEDDGEDGENGREKEEQEDGKTPPPSSRRKRKNSSTDVPLPSKKRVTFATNTMDGNEQRTARIAVSKKKKANATTLTSSRKPAKASNKPVGAPSKTAGNDAYDFDQFFKS